MKIIVTGAIGHIGSYVIRDLGVCFPRAEIVMIDNMMTQRFPSLFNLPSGVKYQFIEGDVSEMNLKSIFIGADAVIHLAAISNDPAALLNSKITWETNVLYTLHLLNECKKAGIKKIT